MEAKEYDLEDAIILYHDKKYKLKTSYYNGKIVVRSNIPIKFNVINQYKFKNLVQNIELSDPKTILINTKIRYQTYHIVDGEKLTAVKFSTTKKFNNSETGAAPTEKKPKQEKVVKQENSEMILSHQKQPEQKEEKTENLQNVSVTKKSDAIELKLPFDEQIGISSFKRDNKIFVALDKKTDLKFPDTDLFVKPKQIQSDDGQVFMFAPPEGYFMDVIPSGKDWILRFKKVQTKTKNPLKLEVSPSANIVSVSGGEFKKIISFTDEEIGDKITMITDASSKKNIDTPRYFNDFIVYPSVWGVAIVRVAEDLRVSLATNNKVEIQSSTQVPTFKSKVESEIKLPEAPGSQNSEVSQNSYIPFGNYNKPDPKFLETKTILLKRIISATKATEKDKMATLSVFYFERGLLHEALGSANNITIDAEFLEKNPEFPFYKSVIYSLLGRYKDANEILQTFLKLDIPDSLRQEAEVWQRYNSFQMGEKMEYLNITKYLDGFVKNYPDEIYWKLVFAEFEIAASNNDLNFADAFFKKVRHPSLSEDLDMLNFYKGTFFKKNKRYNQAANYYDTVKLDPKRPKTYVRSQFDKIDMLVRIQRMNIGDAVNNLRNLSFLWRGDKLEYEILLKIGELLQTGQQYLKALRIYKYILDAFPEDSGRVYISQQMAEIYNNFVFNEGGMHEKMSDFELVSIYYEFRELTPLGEAGDKITLAVAGRLIKLDLLDQAEKILDHQIKYRLSGRDKIISGDHLAAIYIMNKKAQLAIDVLNETDSVNFGFLEHVTRVRLKAKAMIDMGNFAGAIESLKNDDSLEAKMMKEEAYFKMADWEHFSMLAESSVLQNILSGKLIPQEQEKEVLRLAISYSQMGKNSELKLLGEKLNTNNDLLRESINLLVLSGETFDIYSVDNRFKVDEVEKYFKSIVNKLFDFK
ncbi:MAG: hypothetical protein SFT91_06170 [Rickettsiaceae bacterium]|nr:hypothetical protein [Rickettsiaceae bacterium]